MTSKQHYEQARSWSDKHPDDIVDAWHDGGWPGEELHEVMCRLMGWSLDEFKIWAVHPAKMGY